MAYLIVLIGTSHSHAIRSKNGKEGKTWNDNKSSNRTTRRVGGAMMAAFSGSRTFI